MDMDLKKLSEPLNVDQIDFRVQSINNGGYATILAYKDARVDMERLDAVVGALNWKREHVNNNANCIVSIWNDKTGQWISKEDTGTASNTEAAKGLASDSFKRACFNWGIGRELYDYPVISVKLNADEITEKNGKKYASWNFKLKEWQWKTAFKQGKLVGLAAIDQKGNTRFSWSDEAASVFLANLKQLKQYYAQCDSEGLLMAFDAIQQDEALVDSIWSSMDSKTRDGMKKMIADERKQQKEG
jgi:hypothetical protein